MGSACLFFAVRPQKAILGDINGDLVNTFLQVRDRPRDVWKALAPHRGSKRRYYTLRSLDPGKLTPVRAAARFIYLNRFCFNGLYRTNLKGQFNVPYAPSGTGKLPNKEHLLECSRVLHGVVIKARDFLHTLSNVKAGDFVYMDPPFAVESRRVFNEYGPQNFGEDDLKKLAGALERIDAADAYFVVSYADCAEARRHLGSWSSVRVRTRRNIAGFAEKRRHAYELIVTNTKA